MRASSCATTAARRSRMIYFEDEPGRRRLRHDAGPALRPARACSIARWVWLRLLDLLCLDATVDSIEHG